MRLSKSFGLGTRSRRRLLLLLLGHQGILTTQRQLQSACQLLLQRCEECMAQAWYEPSKQPKTFSVAWYRSRKGAGYHHLLHAQKPGAGLVL